ncbi:MAG: MTH1187 family thiamine-binding protein [Solidesulfovibrio sp. DCME]|uniref:MTH1187 family thiamine-binding protein n=1 Tax=Solidesulfovibrio sp. DCME TaxID=3447380 RepID=UPI003D13BAD9
MSAILDFSIFPLDKGVSLSTYVARAVRIVKESGLPYVFSPMSTSIEGEWDEVMAVVSRCKEALEADCGRIHLVMRVDLRDGPGGRLVSKIRAVEEKL